MLADILAGARGVSTLSLAGALCVWGLVRGGEHAADTDAAPPSKALFKHATAAAPLNHHAHTPPPPPNTTHDTRQTLLLTTKKGNDLDDAAVVAMMEALIDNDALQLQFLDLSRNAICAQVKGATLHM
jgi:hypothetical protein